MPLIEKSTYRPPVWMRGAHFQTIHPALFRKVAPVTLRRERLELEDADFLDLEWSGGSGKRLAREADELGKLVGCVHWEISGLTPEEREKHAPENLE
jgi:predicted alpha/beta-fold hydrolase